MEFKAWLFQETYHASQDYNKTWYHGTWDLTPVEQSGVLKIRGDAVKSRNAAAMGIGVYLTDDFDEAKAYVPNGRSGGVVSVSFVKKPHFLRLANNKEDNRTFEELRQIGLENPEKVNQIVSKLGFNGIHWDLIDNTQKVVAYDPHMLSKIQVVARMKTTPGTLDSKWEK